MRDGTIDLLPLTRDIRSALSLGVSVMVDSLPLARDVLYDPEYRGVLDEDSLPQGGTYSL